MRKRAARRDERYLLIAETMKDGEYAESYLEHHHFARSQITVIPLSPDAEEWFLTRGWNVTPLRELVDLDATAERRYVRSSELANTWASALRLRDTFFETVAVPDFVLFFRHALACDEVLRAVLPRHALCTLLLLPETRLPLNAFDAPVDELACNGIFNAMLRWQAAKQRLRQVELQAAGLTERLHATLRPWRRAFRFVRRYMPTWRVPARAAMALLRDRAPRSGDGGSQSAYETDAVVLNWGVDAERLLNLAELLGSAATSDLRLVHLYDPTWGLPLTGVATNFAVDAPPNQRVEALPSIPLDEAEYVREFVFRTAVVRIWRWLRSRKELGRVEPWLENRRLGFQFLYMFVELYSHMFRERLRTLEILRRFTPRVVIGSDTNGFVSRARMLTASAAGVATMTINHGVSLHALLPHELIGDVNLVGGAATAENMGRSGVVRGRVRVIGCPSPARAGATRRASTPRVIVTSASSSWPLWSTFYRVRDYLRFLERVCKLLADHTEWSVILKAHPGVDNYRMLERMVARLNRQNLTWTSSRWDREEFGRAHAAVVFDVSTVILDLQSMSVPVVFVPHFVRPFIRPDYAGVGEIGSTPEQVDEVVTRILRDGDFRSSVIQRGQQFFRRYYDVRPGTAEPFASAIREIREAQLSAETRAAGLDLEVKGASPIAQDAWHSPNV